MKLIIVLLAMLSLTANASKVYEQALKEYQQERGATYTIKEYNREFTYGLQRPEGWQPSRQKIMRFRESDAKLPKAYSLYERAKAMGAELTGIFDQGSCGSCVYNSVLKNGADLHILRGHNVGVLSRQFIMDCPSGMGSCGGDWFMNVAKALTKHGGVTEASYPYKARNQSCKGNPPVVATFLEPKEIDNSPKSIMTAIYQGYPVSVTVAAGGSWSSYSSGIFSGNGGWATNHQVLAYAWDCETSVDKDGFCVLDANGYPINGDGWVLVPNSWGEDWGENGLMRSRWGRAKLAEEAGILETDSAPTPFCGDKVVQAPEQCDPPGPIPGNDKQSCSQDCKIVDVPVPSPGFWAWLLAHPIIAVILAVIAVGVVVMLTLLIAGVFKKKE